MSSQHPDERPAIGMPELAFIAQQATYIAGIVGALTVAGLGSFYGRPLFLPLLTPYRPFINLAILGLVILFFGIGLFTVFRKSDRGWPIFLFFVGLVVFAVAFEDHILQFWVFQGAIQTAGGRVNPISITASAAAVAFAILLHQNQVSQRMKELFTERGIDQREIAAVPLHMRMVAHRTLWPLVAAVGAVSVILFVVGAFVGSIGVGLAGFGIMGGLIVVLAIGTALYQVLRQGPAVDADAPTSFDPRLRIGDAEHIDAGPTPHDSASQDAAPKKDRRRPPAGLRRR